jgi:hypothetical protein
MTAYLVDVATMLQSASVGSIPTTLRYGRLPEDPNNLVVVRGYGGRGRQATHTGSKLRYPRVQIVCRNTDPAAAWAKAEAVHAALDNVRNVDVNGTSYVQVAPTGEPYEIPSDTSGRTVVACNFEVWVIGSWS